MYQGLREIYAQFGVGKLRSNILYPQYISPTHPKFCKLLLSDIANMMGKRSVGSRWWLVCQHGHYHHGSDNRVHGGSTVDGGLVLG